ncbi:MAG TPA: hypothetical protein VIY08_03270 [Candidatus Nitrosocosmicus sp.]
MSQNNKSYFGKNNYVFTVFDDIITYLSSILTNKLIINNQFGETSKYISELNRLRKMEFRLWKMFA